MVTKVLKKIDRSLYMIGTFPPPTHGMAAVNAAALTYFRQMGVKPTVINLAAPSLERSPMARLGRLPRVLRAITKIAVAKRALGKTVYMSISGGLGQVYELLIILLARSRRMRLYLHHHSFAYIDKPKRLTSILIAVAGPASVHIALSPGMARKLQDTYPRVRRITSVSNSVFFQNNNVSMSRTRRKLNTIGFISNISIEKGIIDFLDLVERYESENIALHAVVAGPFIDSTTERIIKKKIRSLRTVTYIGPQYGEDKDKYFDTIDVLIFPTHYVNEAEPMTIHEAMQRAIPVIAYGRGSIPEIVGRQSGMVISPNEPFASDALLKISQWLDRPEEYIAASRASKEQFIKSLEKNLSKWKELSREMLS